MIRIIALVIFSFIITGCVKEPPPPDLPNVAQFELSEAAVSVDRSLDNLNEISAERAILVVEPHTQEQLDYEMRQLASVDWVGPGEPLVRELAHAVGYHVRVIGKAPVFTGIVTLDKRQVPVGELLRDVALQMESTADIVVFPKSKLIEIRYF